MATPKKYLPLVKPWCHDLLPGLYCQLGPLTVGLAEARPDPAKTILEKYNPHNRPPSKSHRSNLGGAMGNGEWKLNGGTISFTRERVLADGQNRLGACVETGVPFQTLVVLDIEPEAFDTIDQGLLRTVAQILGIRGEENTTALASGSNSLQNFCQTGIPVRKSARGARPREHYDALAAYPGLRASAAFVRPISARSGILGMTGSTVAMHYVMSRVDRKGADELFGGLAAGTHASGPANLLQQTLWTLHAKRHRQRLTERSYASFVVKTWNAVRTGEPLLQLKVLKDEKFPQVHGVKYENDLPVLPKE